MKIKIIKYLDKKKRIRLLKKFTRQINYLKKRIESLIGEYIINSENRDNELKHLYHQDEDYIALKVPEGFPLKVLNVPSKVFEKEIRLKKDMEVREEDRKNFIEKYKLRRKKVSKPNDPDCLMIETKLDFEQV